MASRSTQSQAKSRGGRSRSGDSPAPRRRERPAAGTAPVRRTAPPAVRSAASAAAASPPADVFVDRTVWKGSTQLGPVPAVLVTSGGGDESPNVATVAWTGTVCSDPPMLSISLRAATLTHGIVLRTREFVVNMPTERIARATDLCGVVSGRDGDKFAKAGLTPVPATQVRAPIVAECPVALECRVRQVLELGLHTMFVAEIVAVSVASRLIDPQGRLAIEKAGLIAFAHGHYFALGRVLGTFGFSVRKKKPGTPR